MMLGARTWARPKRALTSFSDSPRYLLVKLLAEMEKNVDLDSVARAQASIVLLMPGGGRRDGQPGPFAMTSQSTPTGLEVQP
jgi:hypothetical protein